MFAPNCVMLLSQVRRSQVYIAQRVRCARFLCLRSRSSLRLRSHFWAVRGNTANVFVLPTVDLGSTVFGIIFERLISKVFNTIYWIIFKSILLKKNTFLILSHFLFIFSFQYDDHWIFKKMIESELCWKIYIYCRKLNSNYLMY